jgi:protein SCO1
VPSGAPTVSRHGTHATIQLGDMMQRVRLFVWALVGIAAALAGSLSLGKYLSERNTALGPGVVLDVPFTLTTHDGRTVTQTDFRSKPTAWFFGFTHCPDVCPTTLMQMTDLLGKLGPDADKLNVVFITVDPKRDSQQVQKDYLSAFDPRIVGLTGPQGEIERLAKGYFVYFAKVPLKEGGYTMDHTAAVLLTDKVGRFMGTLDYHEPAEMSLAKLKRLIAAGA